LTSWIEAQPDFYYLVEAANNTSALYTNKLDELNIQLSREDIVNKKFDNKRLKIRKFFGLPRAA